MNQGNISLLISIVVYNTEICILERLFRSILVASGKVQVSVVVFDNGFGFQVEELCNNYSYRYIKSEQNLGFGKGHNHAIFNSSIHADFLLILNPDVILEPDTLLRSCQYMYENRNIAALSPLLFNVDNSPQIVCREYPTLLKVAYRFLFQKRSYRIIDRNKILNVDALHGACLFVRYEYFISVGGFAPDYFLYLEDIDLCRKLKKYGDIIFFPHASAIHFLNKESSRNLKLFFIHLQSFYIYFKKWGFKF